MCSKAFSASGPIVCVGSVDHQHRFLTCFRRHDGASTIGNLVNQKEHNKRSFIKSMRRRRRRYTCRVVIATLLSCLSLLGPTSSSSEAGTVHEEEIFGILGRLATSQQEQRDYLIAQDRPFVSLCFAQSLDGKLALYTTERRGNDDDDDSSLLQVDKPRRTTTTSNLAISGPASLLMTHALRSAHDAILIGGKTLATDNPRLSNRLWQTQEHQPRPVVLDSHLRHLHTLAGPRKARNVIVCCADSLDLPEGTLDDDNDDVTFLPCRTTKDGRLDLLDVLQKLRRNYGITSVMVEGGPTVIDTFVKAKLFDCFCVTVAPKIFGNGVSLTEPCDLSSSGAMFFHRFDNDICMVYFPSKAESRC